MDDRTKRLRTDLHRSSNKSITKDVANGVLGMFLIHRGIRMDSNSKPVEALVSYNVVYNEKVELYEITKS